jgi:hypothetical protein
MKAVSLILAYQTGGRNLPIVTIKDEDFILRAARQAISEAAAKVERWREKDALVASAAAEDLAHLKRTLVTLVPGLLEEDLGQSLATGGLSHGG